MPARVAEPARPPRDAGAEPRRLRVALVGPAPSAHGGVAGFVQALLDSSLSSQYHLVPVATHRDGSRARKLVEAVRGLAYLRRLCARRSVDVVHVHSSWKASLVRKSAAVAIARAYGRPVILQLHGSGFRPGPGAAARQGALALRLARLATRAADAVIVATPAAATDAARLLGVEAARVVPNTVASAPSRDGHAPPGPGAPQTLLFLGRLERAKGVFELVEAVARLRAEQPRLRLVLAGHGRDAAALARLIGKRGLADAVELPGWLDGDAKQRLLSTATCLVLPSHAEGLPLAVLEAMLSGLPVVASAVGGIPEAARDGVDALLVPPGDVEALTTAIGRVLADDDLARRLAGSARERALAEFSPERVSADLARLYADVHSRAVAGKGASRR